MWLGEGVEDGVGPITNSEQPFSQNWKQMKILILAFELGHFLATCPFLLSHRTAVSFISSTDL